MISKAETVSSTPEESKEITVVNKSIYDGFSPWKESKWQKGEVLVDTRRGYLFLPLLSFKAAHTDLEQDEPLHVYLL